VALESADRAMLDYAVALTRDPGAMGEEDVRRLRDAGFDDRGVLDICQVTSYFCYVNRLADGTGVELEAYWAAEELTATREEVGARRKARLEAR